MKQSNHVNHVKYFKGCIPQISFSPFLNALPQINVAMSVEVNISWFNFLATFTRCVCQSCSPREFWCDLDKTRGCDCVNCECIPAYIGKYFCFLKKLPWFSWSLKVFRFSWSLKVFRFSWSLKVLRFSWPLKVFRFLWSLKVFRFSWSLKVFRFLW